MSIFSVCVIQESPIFFNKAATLEKVEELCQLYAARGCRLLVFPESFVPGYPRGFTFGATIGNRTAEGRELYRTYYENSVDLGGPDRSRLETLCRELNVYLVLGVTEKEAPTGTLYCSMAYFSPSHGLLGVHRKIKPTGTERLVWGEAGGESLLTFRTQIGLLGGLICWENYMPLARMAMYRNGVEIYIAPTADSRPEWTSTMQHVALEGRCFVLGCNQYFTRSMYPETYQRLLSTTNKEICPGGSVIVSPLGEILAGPLFGKAGALEAKVDLAETVRGKMDFDVAGHYARPDIFQLNVRDQPEILKEVEKPRCQGEPAVKDRPT